MLPLLASLISEGFSNVEQKLAAKAPKGAYCHLEKWQQRCGRRCGGGGPSPGLLSAQAQH